MTRLQDTTTTPLSDNALEEYLDNLIQSLNLNDLDEDSVRKELREHTFEIRTVSTLSSLVEVLLRLSEHDDALQALKHHTPALLNNTPADQKVETEIHLALIRLRIGYFTDDRALLSEATETLTRLQSQSDAMDGTLLELPVWTYYSEQFPEISVKGFALQLKILEDHQETRSSRYFSLQENRALLLLSLNQREQAHTIITSLLASTTDTETLIEIASTFADVAPELSDLTLTTIRNSITEQNIGRKWGIEIQLARLQARHRYASGDLAGALALCPKARFSLASHELGDHFIEYELPWLIEAGRTEEAGRLTFQHLYHLEGESNSFVLRHIHSQLANPQDNSPWWPLCFGRAALHGYTFRHLLKSQSPDLNEIRTLSPVHTHLLESLTEINEEDTYPDVADAALNLALSREPNHAWTRRIKIWKDYITQKITPAELATLTEQAVADEPTGDMNEYRTARTIMEARLKSEGLIPAFQNGLIPLNGAYSIFVFTNILTEIYYEGFALNEAYFLLDEAGQKKAEALVVQARADYFAHALTRMEECFTTGRGNWMDGCPHIYAMLCCNYSQVLDYLERRDEGIEVCHKGINTSSFAELYNCIFAIQLHAGRQAEALQAAEDIWQYATENNQNRQLENKDFRAISDILRDLDRLAELPMWFERLVSIQTEENEENEAALSRDALDARLRLAYNLAFLSLDMANTITSTLRPQFSVSDDAAINVKAANVLDIIACNDKNRPDQLGIAQESLSYYQKALSCHNAEERLNRAAVESAIIEIKNLIEELEQLHKISAKPWWKFWA